MAKEQTEKSPVKVKSPARSPARIAGEREMKALLRDAIVVSSSAIPESMPTSTCQSRNDGDNQKSSDELKIDLNAISSDSKETKLLRIDSDSPKKSEQPASPSESESSSSEPSPRKSTSHDADDAPRYQSSRAAAMVAKGKLALKPQRLDGKQSRSTSGTPRAKDGSGRSKTPKSSDANIDDQVEIEAPPWVQCDICSKWRLLPKGVDPSTLPEVWQCSMNIWDALRNNCEAEEEEYTGESADADLVASIDAAEEGKEGRGKVGKRGGKSKRSADDANNADRESDDEARSTKKRSRFNSLAPGVMPVVEKVNWVQCNKCTKWRKVPLSIKIESLPDVWFCALNTWNLGVAKCTAKEENDNTVDSGGNMAGHLSPTNRSRQNQIRRNSSSISHLDLLHGDVPQKKVTQWVQCERKSCKKWRKLPPYVDMSQLPEKWFCEMNKWSPDRANCDCSEDSDSEPDAMNAEQRAAQLLFATNKGPGSLSYRRIIFGPDGKVRSSYSEKNKNGYGLFSFAHDAKASEDAIEMQRRTGYWWSSAYDESGANFLSACRSYTGTFGPKKEVKVESKDAQPGVVSSQSYEQKNVEVNGARSDQSLLLSSINRYAKTPTPLRPLPVKMVGVIDLSSQLSVKKIQQIECTIIRSLLLSSKNYSVSFSNLLSMLETARFMNPEEESCRVQLSVDNLRIALKRLEDSQEITVFYNLKGDMIVQSLHYTNSVEDPFNGAVKSLPPKLRDKNPNRSFSSNF